MRVRREIAERTKRDVSIGAVSSKLERLAAKGLVKSAPNDSTHERGGRAKRYSQPAAWASHRSNRARQELGSVLDARRGRFPPFRRRDETAAGDLRLLRV